VSKKKRRDDSYFAAERRKKRKYMTIIIPIIAAVAVAGAAAALLYKPTPVNAIDGLECGAMEATAWHHHSILHVFVDGKEQVVPAQIGILGSASSPSCYYWLHTHDTTGIIHMEAPKQLPFTLGQFLDVWQQTQPGTYKSTFDSVSSSNKPVTLYVNGQKVQEGNYRDYQLQIHDIVSLVYGNPPTTIPKTGDFLGQP
jgi:hypothetical protein